MDLPNNKYEGFSIAMEPFTRGQMMIGKKRPDGGKASDLPHQLRSVPNTWDSASTVQRLLHFMVTSIPSVSLCLQCR